MSGISCRFIEALGFWSPHAGVFDLRFDQINYRRLSLAIVGISSSAPVLQAADSYFDLNGSLAGSGDGFGGSGYGADNLLEYAFSTLPNASTSVIRPQQGTAADRLTLTFPRTRTDLIYQVEGSSDFVNWQIIATNPGAVGQKVTVSDTVDISTANPPRRFLRLRVSYP